MRFHAGFPLQFWVDVVNTVVYLINRGPLSALDGGILEEAWTGKQVKYSKKITLIVKYPSYY